MTEILGHYSVPLGRPIPVIAKNFSHGNLKSSLSKSMVTSLSSQYGIKSYKGYQIEIGKLALERTFQPIKSKKISSAI